MKLFGHSTSTRASLAPRFAGIALALLSVLTGSKWLMLLACACGGLLIVALVLRPSYDALTVAVTLPARATAGTDLDCLIEVTNTGRGWSSVVHGTHRVSLLDDVVFRVDPLPAGASASLTLPRTAHSRGIATQSTVEFSTTAPLGLRLRKRTADVPLRLIVHPAEVPVVVPPPRAGSENTDWVVSRTGIDVHGIREWRPGDDASQVHWRSSARRGRLVVLEREMPKPGGLVIVLAAAPGDPSWESAVSIGAWTGVAAVRAGREVVLVSSVSGGAQPGPDDATTILDWCAQSDAALPSEDQLLAAFSFAGRGGDVALAPGRTACTCADAHRGGPATCWAQWASALAAKHDIVLVSLAAPSPGEPDVRAPW